MLHISHLMQPFRVFEVGKDQVKGIEGQTMHKTMKAKRDPHSQYISPLMMKHCQNPLTDNAITTSYAYCYQSRLCYEIGLTFWCGCNPMP